MNKWWVLFEAESGRAVVIGSIEEAETLSQWQEGMTRFHLCGAECLYRKLHGTLHPAAAATGEKQPRITSRDEDTRGATSTATDVPQIDTEDVVPSSDQVPSRRIPPIPLRRFLHRATDLKRASSEPSSRPPDVLGNEGSAARPRQIAAIDQGVTIHGQIQSYEPLYVNGELAGTLDLPNHRLTVGPHGRIRAAVHAREVEVLGVIEGEVRADKIVVRKNATLMGNIWTVVLVIEEGAFFEGQCSKASARVTSNAGLRREATSP